MTPFTQSDEQFLALLRRWIHGDINRREEAELGRLAADDDFRREALEGLRAAPESDHAASLHALEERLRRRAPRHRSVPLWPRMMAIAAVFLALLAALLFVPRYYEKSGAPLAQQQPAGSNEAAPQTAATEPPPGDAEKKLSAPANADKTLPAPASGVAMGKKRTAQPDLQRLDSANAPQPSGYYAAESDEAAPNAGAGAVAEEKSKADAVVMSKPSPPVQSEPANAKRAAPAAKSMPAQEAGPAMGWDNFRYWLEGQARLTDAARNNNVSGFVRLEFNVDASGAPTKLHYLQRLGYGCDEEAARLIGLQKWLPGNGQPIQVDVWFRH